MLRQRAPLPVPQRQNGRKAGLCADPLFPIAMRLQVDVSEYCEAMVRFTQQIARLHDEGWRDAGGTPV